MKKTILLLSSMLAIACNNKVSDRDLKNGSLQDTLIAVHGDGDFMKDAAEGSITEIGLGKFASGHATDQRLKDYGFLMMEDHGHLLSQLKQMAAARNIVLPDSATESHRHLIYTLGPKAGNYFDSAYMAEIITHQKQLSSIYDKVIKTSADTAWVARAKRNQSLITNHLLQLITIKDSINIKKK